ncbi:hypothetical protein SAMN05443575_3287 [Jatrophihabitans endophyticus]|uniref:Htaa protein n=1 Tax=Jatrophihabitans endophyticus TaxID=1206085 RepID=A0A1M5Q4I9_9ACTN|nr:hypothetical protein [Jatrophihabitans endophyticus]SHH08770.1 hypothetical protein SAMN05443575_3287 [Jatrophihabitans endophyticus]
MTRTRTSRRRGVAAAALLVAPLLAVSAGGLAPAPAGAAPAAQVSVAPGTADPDYATTLHLRGTHFQSVKNGFGGVYVFFGVVRGTWRPSQGGVSGTNYVYVQDTEQKDNHGYQRFVAFPGDPTAYAANGGTVSAKGRWSTDLVVPSATFPARGRSGGVSTIDCRREQCGIITIGAHGVVNPRNETFTPVTFAAPAAATSAAPRRTHSAAAAPRTTSRPRTSAARRTTATTSAVATTSAAATVTTPAPRTSPTVAGLSESPAAASTEETGGGNAGLVVGLVAAGALLVAVPTGLLLRRRRTGTAD